MIVRAALVVVIAALVHGVPAVAPGQVPRPPTIGVLAPQPLNDNVRALVQKLAALGYEDGRSARLIVRTAEGKLDRVPALAEELVRSKADVIVAVNTPGTRAAMQATSEIPIVMVGVGDPLGTGFVSNLSRPGGNVTGITNLSGELAAKRLQILREAIPGARRVAVFFNPDDPVTRPQTEDTERAARRLAVGVRFLPVRSDTALGQAFRELVSWRADAALWLAGQQTVFIPGTIELAARYRVPVMVVLRSEVEAGGLISYYPDQPEQYARAAVYVDRILRGAKPGDLPVEQPTKFDLVVNLRTAKALGVSIPPALRLRADHVIE